MVSGSLYGGGAAIATHRLAEELSDSGHHVTRLVFSDEGSGHVDPTYDVRSLRTWPLEGPGRWALRRADFAGNRAIRRFLNRGVHRRLSRWIEDIDPHVINLHNLHGPNWDSRLAGLCAETRPTVWTLHDMWSFTGGCSYSYDCRKFLSGCDEECPVAEEFPPISPDEIHSEWAEKRDLIPAGEDLYAVTPSRWLRELACSGMWPEENVTVIRNGLDIGFYRSGDNREARESLGLPLDQRLILTTKPNERRKGSLLLAPTIQSVDEDIDLVAFGAGEFDKGQTDRPIHDFGYVDEEEKVLLFNAADLYLHPAPVDNYPNTVLEALACRTPVFGFEVGGLSEMVEEGVDGYLADRLDPGRLAALVDEFLRGTLEFKEERRDRQGLRREMQAKEYIELFQRICN